jgi:magnesium/cobalt transport protein CorA
MMIQVVSPPLPASREASADAGGCPQGIRAEFLDFRDRSRGTLQPAEIPAEIDRGRFVWIDVDAAELDGGHLSEAFPPHVCPAVDFRHLVAEHAKPCAPAAAGLRRTDRLLQLTFLGGATCGPDDPCERLDVVIGEGFLVTVHRGPNGVLDAVRRDYVHDFEQHAATPSFLLYEICNEQVEQFLAVQTRLEEEVEDTRRALAGEIDQAAFVAVAAVSAKLLTLRRRVLPVRRALDELTSRKTTLVSEATLTFLGGMIDTLERLLSDIAADREILETALNLSLTVMSHRTNQTMNRLAVVSTIFLPLTFICGIYGMNFEGMPEVDWAHGYIYFWGLSACITAGLVVFLRRARLL